MDEADSGGDRGLNRQRKRGHMSTSRDPGDTGCAEQGGARDVGPSKSQVWEPGRDQTQGASDNSMSGVGCILQAVRRRRKVNVVSDQTWETRVNILR